MARFRKGDIIKYSVRRGSNDRPYHYIIEKRTYGSYVCSNLGKNYNALYLSVSEVDKAAEYLGRDLEVIKLLFF